MLGNAFKVRCGAFLVSSRALARREGGIQRGRQRRTARGYEGRGDTTATAKTIGLWGRVATENLQRVHTRTHTYTHAHTHTHTRTPTATAAATTTTTI